MKKYNDITISAPYGNKITWFEKDYEKYSCIEGAYFGKYAAQFYVWIDKQNDEKSSSYIAIRVHDQVFTKYPQRIFTRRAMMLFCSKFIDEIDEYFYQQTI